MNKFINSFLTNSFLTAAVAVTVLCGCEEQPNPLNSPPAKQVAVDDAPKWITQGASVVLPAGAPADDPALSAAMEESRATVADARKRWEHAPPNDRTHWAVKWAAPLETGEVEYIWVRPEHWSPFRVEGVLLSEPINTLRDDIARGEHVSFPAEELCDWAHVVAGTTPLVIEGNFTEAALTKRAKKSLAEPAQSAETE